MLADLFHAPGETTGARTQGSSEAIMLGALSLKWNWRTRQQAAGKPTDRPNLIFGGDVHVVWEKFCRYFDVEPRIVPLAPGKYTIGPDDVAPHIDENTIGVAAVLGTTFTGHMDDIVGINDLLVRLKKEQGHDVPLHVDGASGGFVWPFLYPDSPWDFRLEQVRSINVSGHKFGLVYPGIGWLIFREKSDLAPDLVFEENYLGKTDATFTLNFSTGSSMVLAQYYNFVRYGRPGYTYIMKNMQENARVLADKLEAMGRFEIIGREEEQLPLVAFRLAGERELRRVRHRLAALGRARLDGAGLHPAAERAGRHDHAGTGQGDDEPRARRHPGPRHRGRLPDAVGEGPGPPHRAPDDRHRPGALRWGACSRSSPGCSLGSGCSSSGSPGRRGWMPRSARSSGRCSG